ncbi:MAG TPA: hypothetical protein VFA26_23025 [Gemmataceae bacterium]|nr:hypothetical protein [Gemmataceae bacterium]
MPGGKMECPAGLWGLGTAPVQSLAGFLVLFALLLAAVLADRTGGARAWVGLAVGLVLGVLLTVAAVKSVVPVKLPPEELEGEPKICRPPQTPPA